MKKSILTLLVLFSFQIATSQEKEEQKQKEQKVIREENGSVVLKSYQNVTVDTKKEEKKKEEKTSSETPFGIPLEVKVTLPDSLILTEKPFYLRTLKKEYSKEYFKEGSPLQIFSNSRNKNPEHFLEKDETQLSFEKNKDKSFSVYVPSLRANKLYFLETKTISEIVKVFILIKQEGAPNYECPKKWMVLLKRLNDKILAKPEKFNGQSIYFFPTKKELEEFRAKLKSENLTKENLFDQPEDAIIELAIETFPILNCSNPKLDCPDFSKSKILRFIEWVLDPKKQEFTNDDTWVFGDFGQEAYGIGLYLDYENVYEFYEKHLSSKLEVLDNNRGDEITMIVEREFEKQIKRYNELNEIPPNYPFIKPGTNDEINPNLFKDFSTYPAKFETSFINSITLDFGLSTFLLGPIEDMDFKGALFLGANVALEPVNKNVPMALSDLSCKQRLAFHTGITITSLEESNKREDFFNRVSWMIGGSYKAFTQATRLNTGVILYNKIDAISGDKSLGFAPYFGLSIDLEIGKWIQKSIPSIGGNFKN